MLKIPASKLEELFPPANKPVKDYFFPQTEDIVSFKVNKKEITVGEVSDAPQPFVLNGVKPCDAESLKILDRVFLSDPIDTFYQKKREAATIITTACFEPEETCFCENFGINPVQYGGGDVSTWKRGDTVYWESRTEKGHELTAKYREFFDEAENVEFPNNNTQFTINNANLSFDAVQWDTLYKSCLACGTCTFTCPTCHCYDIQDFNTGAETGKEVKRFRCWDSCMYSDFTLMAHGNPRTTHKERFRQRFMHKLNYFPENNDGVAACVGCGRCIAKCPVNMHILKVMKAFGDKNV